MDPSRGTDTLFVVWTNNRATPQLEVDIPSAGGSTEVWFYLQLPTGRQSWSTWLESTPGTTAFVVPAPPEADPSVVGMLGLLKAVARLRNSDGDVVSSDGSDTIPVTLSAGALANRVGVPVRTQVEIGGVVYDSVEDAGIGMPVETPFQLLTDEVQVDRE